jgi:hypothetical protein
MDLVASVINAAMIATAGLLLGRYAKGRFDSLNARMDRLERSVDSLRTDLTQVALSVGAGPRAERA